MLLVVTYSRAARQTLRNVCNTHDEAIVQRFGRAVLFEETEFGAFLALRLHGKHGGEVQIERTESLNEFRDVPDAVREAANEYEARDHESVPYAKFAVGTDHPKPASMRDTDL